MCIRDRAPAPAPAPAAAAEPAVIVHPKERRRAVRQRSSTTAGPSLTIEERQAERLSLIHIFYCVIRSPFKDKDSREHFEIRTHKRLIDIHQPTPKTVDSLQRLDHLPAGVDIEIRLAS